MNLIKNLFNSHRRNLIGRDELLSVLKDSPELQDYLFSRSERFFSGSGADVNKAIVGLSQIRLDGHPEYISEMLARVRPHDEDYIIFRAFSDSESVVLDVGANWGYSVGSLRLVGVGGVIVSFEAIPLYAGCLQRIKDLNQGEYNFLMTALSSQRGMLEFTVPVVNGLALTALTSASPNPRIDSLVNNIHHFIVHWMPDIDRVELTFCQFKVPVEMLDSVLDARADILSARAVSAMKIDVEGLEFEVLRGGEGVLRRDCPLIMTEGGNRREGMREFMSSLGYLYYERSGDRIYPVSGLGRASNGFFAHTSKLDFYERRGILGK